MNGIAPTCSTAEQVALKRESVLEEENISFEETWNQIHQKVCNGWIKQNAYKKICLQFPDDLLVHSVPIRDSIKAMVSRDVQVFILADTTYVSCCIDEVAAAHVEADCIIHFGNACRSKVSRLPVLYIFPHLPFELEKCLERFETIKSSALDKEVCVYLDIGFHYLLDINNSEADVDFLLNKIKEALCCKQLLIEAYPSAEDIKTQNSGSDDRVCIFIGADNSRFSNLSLTTKAAKWYIYNPKPTQIAEVNPLTTKYIRKRYFYIEKCKDAAILGLIVATLTTDGYLDIISRIQDMAKGHGIKTKIISVGRINPAKLANFLEVDCFVLIGCPFNNLYNDKNYYKPIVSVFEAEMALNPAWLMKYPESYVTNFKQLLPEGKCFLPFESDKIENHDISLVSGKMRNIEIYPSKQNGGGSDVIDKELSVESQPSLEILTSNTGLTLDDRTWKGLDPALGLTEASKLQKGLSGIPIKYTHD